MTAERAKVILQISDSSLGIVSRPAKEFSLRLSPRAVLVGKAGKIALLNVSKKNYWKLPGGGMKLGESIQSALERELLEETGCSAQIGALVGTIVERRERFGLIQISHCYLARAKTFGKTSFEPGEEKDGFSLNWVSLKEAKALLEKSRPENYEGKFIVARDLEFVKAALNTGK